MLGIDLTPDGVALNRFHRRVKFNTHGVEFNTAVFAVKKIKLRHSVMKQFEKKKNKNKKVIYNYLQYLQNNSTWVTVYT